MFRRSCFDQLGGYHPLYHRVSQAMRGLVQPDSVSNTALGRSASPRSREPASVRNAAIELSKKSGVVAIMHPAKGQPSIHRIMRRFFGSNGQTARGNP